MLVIADWPEQLFIQKALTSLHQQNTISQIPASIDTFIPILDSLYVLLNSQE